MKSLQIAIISCCIVSLFVKAKSFSIQDFIESIKKPNNWKNTEQFLDKGPMNNFFDYNTTVQIFNESSKEFPGVVLQPFEFGKTFENNIMYASAITLKKSNLVDQQGILINSLHHGREMLSLSIQMYTFAKILSDYASNDENIINLLQSTVICIFKNKLVENNVNFKTIIQKNSINFFQKQSIIQFSGICLYELSESNIYTNVRQFYLQKQIKFIPAVNVDGLIHLKDLINDYRLRDSVRKNFNRGDCSKQGSGGVDLNRNYDEHFGVDTTGSSPNPCEEDYRGKSAFSEPETQAMKKFVEDRKNIKVAFNFHSYGNMWIRPVNYSPDKENKILQKMYREYHVYSEFDKEVTFAPGTKNGNANKALEGLGFNVYLANGEATDWMLLKRKIIAFSPEIGAENSRFFPEQPYILGNLVENYPPIHYMFMKMLFNPILESSQFLNQTMKEQFIKKYNLQEHQNKNKLNIIEIEIFNKGIGDLSENELKGSKLDIKFEHSFIHKQGQEDIETGDSSDSTVIIDSDNNNKTTKKQNNFNVSNIFFIDYSEDFRTQKLQEDGMKGFISDILDFKLKESSFKKMNETKSVIEMKLKGNHITYEISFDQTFEGRSYRKYYIVFTSPIYASSKINYEIKITAGIGNAQNQKSYNLNKQFVDLMGFVNTTDQDEDKPIEKDKEEEEDNLSDKFDGDDDDHHYFLIIFIIGLALILLIFKFLKTKNDNKMQRFDNESSTINEIEVN